MQRYHKPVRVFQRMHGADEFPGTGVSLAIVMGIVTTHGGRIRAEAVLGQGAVFFSIPRAKDHARGLALAAASLFALAPLAVHADDGASADPQGFCHGVNACKGNSKCKGQGFVDSVTKSTCDPLGGRFDTRNPMQKN